MAPDLIDSSPEIVIGFVGGFIRHDDGRREEVRLARRLRDSYKRGVFVEVFENRHKKEARQTIFRLLDANHDGILTDQEKRSAHIILYGHSWGGSTVVALARELQRDGIPIRLTIQVDSIAKPGQKDGEIPANVGQAVNFYQTHGILHGRTRIIASDPTHTAILGNFRSDLEKQPSECRDFPWYDRVFLKGHAGLECDPQLWSRVETLIGQRLTTPASADSLAESSH